jgi:uncharacterized protein (TIGR02265 family)
MDGTTRFATARSTMARLVEDVCLPSVPSGFFPADDAAPFDPQPHLLGVPADHGVRGLFFNSLLDEAKAQSAAISPARNYVDFKHYPVREWLELLLEAAGRCHPGLSLRGAVRRMGRLAYPTFAASMVGRVMFGILGNDIARVMKVASKGYDCSLTHARVVIVAADDHSVRARFEHSYAFIDAYQVGVFEGAFAACKRQGEVFVRTRSVCEGEIFARWK